MSQIKILPEIVSNKIAAGEVVERPSSVVKELIENSLDAQSTKIVVEIEKGGKSLIRVSDDGAGMLHDDALMAVERYATSKIADDSDLFSIRTLGFRGEALPSIAAVSRFSLITRDRSAQTGTAVRIDGGKIIDVTEIGAPPGTMVTVKQLFFNTPARRKFLKSVATEMGHIVDSLSSMAMGWHAVHFKLLHDGKTVKSWPSVIDPLDRITDVLGRDIGRELQPVTFESQNIFLSGWISSPRIIRSSFRSVYIFVNGRCVRSRLIQHALMAGYEQRLVKGQFPMAVLFVRVPVESVDVNVHPTKQEIRFFDDRGVYTAVAAAVSDTLARIARPGWAAVEASGNKSGEMKKAVSQTDSSVHGSEKTYPADRREAFSAAGRSMDLPVSPPEVREQILIWEQKRFRDLRVIGQLHNTYILCESVDGLILIDQHAAHERVLFEQLKARASAGRMATQRLLIPDVMDLGYNEAEVFERLIPELGTFGFEIEPFGGRTFAVKAVPFLLASKEIKTIVVEMIDKIIEIGFQTSLEKSIEECLTIMACHGAIRANQPLSGAEITALLQELDACDNPAHCPHGRPIWIQWSSRFLDKSFKRIV